MENSIIKIGDEVLIFESDPKFVSNENKFKTGIIKNIEISDKYKTIINSVDFNKKPQVLNMFMCTVLGEDGKEYYGSYYFYEYTPYKVCFLTINDYKHFLYKKWAENDNKKVLLENENNLITKKLDELLKLKQNKIQNFDVLAIPSDKAFVVSKEKSEEFLNQKPNLEIRKEQQKAADEISKIINNEGPVLKKTKKK